MTIEVTPLYSDVRPTITLQSQDAGGAIAARAAAESARLSAEEAAASEAAAEADRVQTGLDRVQTGQDRAQTSLDASATAQDRVQTGQDRTATGADRVQTGQDRSTASSAATVATTQAGIAINQAQAAAVSAGEAEDSADTATAAATVAVTHSGIATTKASEAAASAQSALSSKNSATSQAETATTKASEAAASAAAALISQTSASGSAQTATTKASEASASAQTATAQAGTATTKANEASASAQTASTQAGIASTKASEASGSAQTATAQAGTATTKASEASASAQTASTKASEASASAAAAAGSASSALESANSAEAVLVDPNLTSVVLGLQALSVSGEIQAVAANLDAVQGASENANIAATQAGNAMAAELTAQTAANNAVAVVTGGTASLTASPGKMPIADAAGKIDPAYVDLLAGVSTPLHRSPNAIAAMFIYSTHLDSDGGAWTEKCQHTSWYNEPLSGKWLGAQATEAAARAVSGAATGDYFQLTTDGKFYALSKNLLTSTATLATQTQWLTAGTYTLSSTTGSSGSVAISGAATASHTAGTPTTFTVATSGNVTFTVTGSVLTAQCELGSVATTYSANASTARITEVFRGNKRSFPKVAGIVAEAANLTIYDLTEPGRPMWMRFTSNNLSPNTMLPSFSGTSLSCVSCLNADLMIGNSTYDASRINFVSDTAIRYATGTGSSYFGFGISLRNSEINKFIKANLPGIASRAVNAVAMTVLPDAPVDPVTGLKVPTIAVATAGGISVIQNTGIVRNSSSTSAFTQITLTPQLLSAGRADALWYFSQNPNALGASFALTSDSASVAPDFNDGNTSVLKAKDRSNLVRSSGAVVQVLRNNESSVARGIAAKLSNTFNAGWLLGDIRRCFLSDTTTGSLTGPELVTNGTFDTGTTGWVQSRGGTLSVVSGALRITGDGGTQIGAATTISTTVGRCYKFSCTYNAGTSSTGILLRAASDQNLGTLALTVTYASGSGSFVGYFFATAATMYVGCLSTDTVAGRYIEIDNVSIREAIPDRSYKAAGANIEGTLTAAAVASNAQLVAYSGFSAANYAREPYSADLDFGTGEWSVGAWVNTTQPAVGGNLLTWSEQFDNGAWTKTKATITQDATLAPNGTGTADKLVQNTENDFHYIQQTATVTPNTLYTRSLYLKQGEYYGFSFQGQGASGANAALFLDLRTGTITSDSGLNAAVTPTSNGWYRLTVQQQTSTSSLSNRHYVLKTTSNSLESGDGTSGIYIWGAQLELGSTATTYKPTTNTAILPVGALAHRSFSSGPEIKLQMTYEGKLQAVAFDGTTTRTVTTAAAYNTATWTKVRATYTTDGTLGLTVNGQQVATTTGAPLLTLNSRYNLLNFTEDFSNAAWQGLSSGGAAAGIKTPNYGIAPDGTQTACRVQLDVSGGSAGASSQVAQTYNAWLGAVTTQSAWVKTNNGATVTIRGFTAGSSTPNLLTVTGDWQRFDARTTPATTSFNFQILLIKGTTSDTADLLVWRPQAEVGSTATTYQRIDNGTGPTLAPLTIGNSYALDAPFPGSISLLKFSATVPTAEQAQWMYEQEKQLFREGAQCVLPSSGNVLDLAYDDETDTWSALQATHESTWSGLVRTATQTPSAGSFAKCVAGSGNKLLARTTTNPGVDIQMPARNLRAELRRRGEAMNANQDIVVFDYFGGFTATTTLNSTALTSVAASLYPSTTNLIGCAISGTGIPANTVITGISGTTIYMSKAATANGSSIQISTTDFNLPVGYTARSVMTAGALKREGSTADYTRLFNGFRETIRFAVAPGHTAWVQIQAVKEVA